MNDERRSDENADTTGRTTPAPQDISETDTPVEPEQVDRYEPIPLMNDSSDTAERHEDIADNTESAGSTSKTAAEPTAAEPLSGEPKGTPESDPVSAKLPRATEDRATRAGYPPDSGPEQPVMRVRPVFFRSHPMWVSGAVVIPPLIAFAALWIGGESGVTWALWSGGVLGIVALATLIGWWFIATRSRSIQITNKRTTEIRGLLSKSTDEVLHDHVRNVTIDQSVYERIVNIGTLGIASAGHAETEIVMRDLPNPGRVRDVIDLYRPID